MKYENLKIPTDKKLFKKTYNMVKRHLKHPHLHTYKDVEDFEKFVHTNFHSEAQFNGMLGGVFKYKSQRFLDRRFGRTKTIAFYENDWRHSTSELYYDTVLHFSRCLRK